jgi:hypothetical protein
MEIFDENELRSLLNAWEIDPPDDSLVFDTKSLMYEEMAKRTVPVLNHSWFTVVLGMVLLLTVNLFYMLTLGSILSRTLPPMFTSFLSHSLVAFSVAECSLIAGILMVFFFKHVQFSGISIENKNIMHGLQ